MIVLSLAILASLSGAPDRATTPARLRVGTISNDDYPAAAIQAGEEGTTRVRLRVSADGRATDCSVKESSGSAVLDATTCSLALQRYQFHPARNAQGRTVETTYSQSVRWVLPDADSADFAAFAAGELRTWRHVSENGMRCASEAFGVAFQTVAEFQCSEVRRVPVAELEQEPGAVMTRSVLVPEGQAEAAAPAVQGTLVSTMTVDLEISPNGRAIACLSSPVAAIPVPAVPPSCTHFGNGPTFAPALGDAVRRGRMRLEVYRMGAPDVREPAAEPEGD